MMEQRREIIEKHLNQASEWNCLACECLHCAASVGNEFFYNLLTLIVLFFLPFPESCLGI